MEWIFSCEILKLPSEETLPTIDLVSIKKILKRISNKNLMDIISFLMLMTKEECKKKIMAFFLAFGDRLKRQIFTGCWKDATESMVAPKDYKKRWVQLSVSVLEDLRKEHAFWNNLKKNKKTTKWGAVGLVDYAPKTSEEEMILL